MGSWGCINIFEIVLDYLSQMVNIAVHFRAHSSDGPVPTYRDEDPRKSNDILRKSAIFGIRASDSVSVYGPAFF